MHQIWHNCRGARRNQLWQIFWQSVNECRFCRGSKFAISHWLSQSPLTLGWHYRAARDWKLYRTRMWADAQRDGTMANIGVALCSMLKSLADVHCWSNSAKMRNPLKLAGVPQTTGPISAASGPKFTILWGHVEEILLLNKFFSDYRYVALVAKIWPDKVVWWCAGGNFLHHFCILYF